MHPEEILVTKNVTKPVKPAILCLHGGGTNSMIFGIQCVRLQRVLDPYFEFVFLDGPIEGEPGPGVIPVFEGLGPYRRWHVGGDAVKPEETAVIFKEALEEQRRKDGRGFVGAIGFSQGAKAVAGLLLEQQLRGDAAGDGLAFGVMFNGTTPPLTSNLTDVEKAERIRVPSLHVVGTEDPWREESLKLFGEHFDSKIATLMEFNVGHRLPVLEEHTTKVTNEILRLYAEAEGGKNHSTAGV